MKFLIVALALTLVSFASAGYPGRCPPLCQTSHLSVVPFVTQFWMSIQTCDHCKAFIGDNTARLTDPGTQGKIAGYLKLHVCGNLPIPFLKPQCIVVCDAAVPLIMNGLAATLGMICGIIKSCP